MIFHIFGAQCSGKTKVIEELKSILDIAHWDVLEDFYVKEKIIVNEKMDWDAWRKKEHLMAKRIHEFVKENKDSHIIIESSGTNKNINKAIKRYGVVPIYMGTPTKDEVDERCKERGLKPEETHRFNKEIQWKYDRIKKHLPKVMSIEDTINFIKTKTQEKETDDTDCHSMFDTLTE